MKKFLAVLSLVCMLTVNGTSVNAAEESNVDLKGYEEVQKTFKPHVDEKIRQEKQAEKARKEAIRRKKAEQKRSPGRPRKSSLEKAKDSFLSSLFRTIAREIAKLIMGSFKRK